MRVQIWIKADKEEVEVRLRRLAKRRDEWRLSVLVWMLHSLLLLLMHLAHMLLEHPLLLMHVCLRDELRLRLRRVCTGRWLPLRVLHVHHAAVMKLSWWWLLLLLLLLLHVEWLLRVRMLLV
jgi:hypothetical protein